MLISSVHQSDTVIPMYILFHILFHYGLSQDIESGSLGCRVGLCCWSILYNSLPLLTQTPISTPSPLLATTSLFSLSVCLFLFHRYVDLYYILDSIWHLCHMAFVFLFLTDFTMIISRSIHFPFLFFPFLKNNFVEIYNSLISSV